MIKRFKTFLYEMALPLSIAKKITKNWNPKKLYFEIFSNYDTGPRKGKKPYRIYFNVENNSKKYFTKEIKISKEINIFFEKAYERGILNKLFKVENYILGIAIADEETKKPLRMKIGKLFNKILNYKGHGYLNQKEFEDAKKLLRKFENDPLRRNIKNKNFMIVISHHPYDIAGMSTNRGWTSCMDLYSNLQDHYIYSDIKMGTIIAYLIETSDTNINKPIGRVLIKPYVNIKNPEKFVLVMSEKIYGSVFEDFKKVVQEWVDEVNKKYLHVDTNSLYCIPPSLYDADETMKYIGDPEKLTKLSDDDLLKLLKTTSITYSIAPWHNDNMIIHELLKRDSKKIIDFVRKNYYDLLPFMRKLNLEYKWNRILSK